MSKIQDPARQASATTSDPGAGIGRTTGRRSYTARDSTAPAATADPVADEMRAHAVVAATAAAAEPEDFDVKAVLTLAELRERYGIATPEEVGFYLEGADLEKLAADGAKVATPRITRDGARIWGTIAGFFAYATREQRALVPAITDDLLRVAIWSTQYGQELYAARQGVMRDVATVRTGRTASSTDLRRRSGGQRDVLYTGLLTLAGKKSDLCSRLERVYSKNSLPAAVATSLRDLAKLGREVLADTSPAALQRRRGSLIDEDFLTASETLASEVATLGEVTEALSARPPVLQEEVDLWDGRNLAFLKVAIAAFAAARPLDPSMPRIFPLSLRNVLGQRSRPSKDEPASPPPTPPSPTSTAATPPTDARQVS